MATGGNDTASNRSMLKRIGEYIIDRRDRLGKGTFGSVYRGIHDIHKYPVAAKVINLGSFHDLEESIPFFMNEVSIMEKVVSHPNILHLLHHEITHDYDRDVHELWLVMKLCREGSLNDYFRTHQPNDAEILRFVTQMCEAVAFLHNNGIVHNDIKPNNVLLNREIGTLVIKVADFGLSDTTKRTYMSVKGGSWHYMAPELMRPGTPTHTKKSDVFAVGVLIMHLLRAIYGKQLECKEVQGDRYIGEVMLEKMMARESIDDAVHVSAGDSPIQRELKLLVVDMTRPEHRDRPSMAQVQARLMAVCEQEEQDETESQRCEQQERERREVDRRGQAKQDQDRRDQARRDQERREQERREQERQQQERREQERREQERQQQERREQERQQQERREQEKQQQERWCQARLDQERRMNERTEKTAFPLAEFGSFSVKDSAVNSTIHLCQCHDYGDKVRAIRASALVWPKGWDPPSGLPGVEVLSVGDGWDARLGGLQQAESRGHRSVAVVGQWTWWGDSIKRLSDYVASRRAAAAADIWVVEHDTSVLSDWQQQLSDDARYQRL